ncbi:MAG: alpha/beta hydrolase [Ardenticatenales bacterium]|nr:alpha/beta hydrolase [Ardenticatenales bacterium]
MRYEYEDLSLYYEVHGTGRPVLLLHGRPMDSRAMRAIFEPILAKRPGYQRVYVDLPGMGRTGASEAIQSNDDVAALMARFMADCFPGEPFLLAGLSYGGYISRGILYHAAERVAGMLLLVPAVQGAGERQLPPPLVVAPDPQAVNLLPAPFNEFFNQFLVVQNEAIVAHIRDEILPGMQAADQAMMARLSENYDYSFAVDELVELFDRPVLILCGKHDTVTGYQAAVNLLPLYPRATLAVLDRAGHGLNLEQPALFTHLVDEWLDRVEEYQRQPVGLADLTG